MIKRLRVAGVELVTAAELAAPDFAARRRRRRAASFLEAVRRLAARRLEPPGARLSEAHHVPPA